MQLAQTKVLGSVNNQSVGVWNVDSSFDDGGGNQHVELALPEINHNLLKRVLGHLSVCHSDAGFWH
jgi:hypothetical protein